MLYLPTFNWDFAGYYLRDETLIRDTVIKRLNYTGVVKKQFTIKDRMIYLLSTKHCIDTSSISSHSLIAANKFSRMKCIKLVHVLILNAWIKCQTNLF